MPRHGKLQHRLEINHDVLNGKYLLENEEMSLTEDEATAMREFLVGVEQIPEGRLATASPREGNLRVMSEKMWEPLRQGARELLVTLRDAIARNHEYISSGRST